MIRITKKFFEQPTIKVAKKLLGKRLVRKIGDRTKVGRVVETEAYLGPEDLAAHSSRGLTPRTEVMFGPAGLAYVYLIYGMYYCLNVVTRQPGSPQAVLIRALEPLEGLEKDGEALRVASGPGKLCRWLEVDKSFNKLDLTGSSELFFEDSNEKLGEESIIATARIGVAYAKHYAEKPWRFYVKNNQFISKS